MYRNSVDILSNECIMIDAGSLWAKFGDELVLVDDDQDITSPLTSDFYEVEE